MRSARLVRAALLAALAAAAGYGCSDDVTCPDPGEIPDRPYIHAFVRESVGDGTRAEITVASDPVSSFLVASVNYRGFDDPETVAGAVLVASLDDELVVWQPGTPCTLRVSTDAGFARASAVVPGAPQATSPGAVALGDSLTITWTPAGDADYYTVRGILHAGSDSLVIEESVEDTFVVLAPSVISLSGELTGAVSAVSGPFPAAGAEGNVTGEGQGFFWISYEDATSAFAVTVQGSVRDEGLVRP